MENPTKTPIPAKTIKPILALAKVLAVEELSSTAFGATCVACGAADKVLDKANRGIKAKIIIFFIKTSSFKKQIYLSLIFFYRKKQEK
jgi:hypothetical protein